MNKLANTTEVKLRKVEKIENELNAAQPVVPYQSRPQREIRPENGRKGNANEVNVSERKNLFTKNNSKQDANNPEKNELKDLFESIRKFNVDVLELPEDEAFALAEKTIKKLEKTRASRVHDNQVLKEKTKRSSRILSMTAKEKEFLDQGVRFNIDVLGLPEDEAYALANKTIEKIQKRPVRIMHA